MRRGVPILVLAAVAGCVAPSEPPRAASAAPPPPPLAPAPSETRPPPAPDPRLDGETIQGGLVRGLAPAGTRIVLGGKDVPVASDGRFIIAFDRDAGPQAQLVALLPDGRQWARTLTVAPRAWEIEELPIPKGTAPTAEFLRIRGEELRQIAAARATSTDADGWRQFFRWPVMGRISGLFGSQRVYRGEKGAYHSGTDVARPAGTPVAAPADGVVILAADHPFTLEGNLLMVDHGMGLNSSFLHLSRIDVKVGDHVRQGQIIGAVGMTGRATGPHLHWSLKWRDARIDPLLLAGAMPAG